MWSNEGEWLSGDDDFGPQPKKPKKRKKKAQPPRAGSSMSAAQQTPIPEGMERNDSGFGFKKETPEEGFLCTRGCGQIIPHGYTNLLAHNAEVHPNE